MIGPWWALGLFFALSALSFIGASINGIVKNDGMKTILCFIAATILIYLSFYVADFDVTHNEDYKSSYINGAETPNETYYINCVEYIEIVESKRALLNHSLFYCYYDSHLSIFLRGGESKRALLIIYDKPVYRRCKGYIDGYEETSYKMGVERAKANLSSSV